MEPNDHLLREASDPTTPAGRLARLFEAAPIWDTSEDDLFSPRTRLCHALLTNPSLPLSLILQTAAALPRTTTYAVWHNPTLPLALLSHPDPWLRDMARMALLSAQAHVSRPERAVDLSSLESMIRHWHARGPGPIDTSGRSYVWRLAHRLAFLFDLPWPATTTNKR